MQKSNCAFQTLPVPYQVLFFLPDTLPQELRGWLRPNHHCVGMVGPQNALING
jgi:hypothetical protein